MYERLTFESVMKCAGNCSKCSGMYPIWVYRVEKQGRLYACHYLVEKDGSNKPCQVTSCDDMKKKYKVFFDKIISKQKISGFHAFLLPNEQTAVIFHEGLDRFPLTWLYEALPHLDEFEI